MTNELLHSVKVADKLVATNPRELASALKYFGDDLPLENMIAVELLIETLSDGSESLSLRVRPANGQS